MTSNYQVLLFYKYVTIENPQLLAGLVRVLCERLNLKGRVIVAGEGINATLEGKTADTEAFVSELLKDERFKDLDVKRSEGKGKTFPKLIVKVRSEIVGTHFGEEVDPRKKTAPRVKPEELRTWYETQKDFVVVDMRNDYEFASGHFKDSVPVGISASRDLPKVIERLEPLKEKKVLTVCTGGVRCEKMSAYLLEKGFKDVQQLDGGIHSYMEKYPGKDFLGTLYTFDNRLVMDFGGDREIIGMCRQCGEKTEQYVNCAYAPCHLHFLVCENCINGEKKVYCSKECHSQNLVSQKKEVTYYNQ